MKHTLEQLIGAGIFIRDRNDEEGMITFDLNEDYQVMFKDMIDSDYEGHVAMNYIDVDEDDYCTLCGNDGSERMLEVETHLSNVEHDIEVYKKVDSIYS